MNITTIAKNQDWEIKGTSTCNFILFWKGEMIKHMTSSEVESLRQILSVPLLENESGV